MKRFGIFGTSGMAREAGDIAFSLGYLPLYVARDESTLKAWEFASESILESEVGLFADIPFVIGVGENAVREKIAQRYLGALSFCPLIHPTATFGRGQRERVESARGVIVCAGVRFTSNVMVGDFAIFNQNATIAHDVDVDPFVHVAPGSVVSGNVHLGLRCWVGAGAVINQGDVGSKLCIGNDTVIGSGAVVTRSCEANAVYAGVPAKRMT